MASRNPMTDDVKTRKELLEWLRHYFDDRTSTERADALAALLAEREWQSVDENAPKETILEGFFGIHSNDVPCVHLVFLKGTEWLMWDASSKMGWEKLGQPPTHVRTLEFKWHDAHKQILYDIGVERLRQVRARVSGPGGERISGEGWTVEHDDEHTEGELAMAAACYAANNTSMWPPTWDFSWWKPKDRRRDLIRAAALIVAEIERLDRASASENP
jgi:hypothetical protein